MHHLVRTSTAAVLSLILVILWPLAGGTAAAMGIAFHAVPDLSAPDEPLEVSVPAPVPEWWEFQAAGVNGTMGGPDAQSAVAVNPVRGVVNQSIREGGVELRPPVILEEQEYADALSRRSTRRLWREKTRTTRSVQRAVGAQRGLFQVELPVQIPKPLRSIVGDGAPRIEVSGSETISLSGTSDWTVRPNQFDTERQRQSGFPSLEMKQELNVNMTGSIGDKIKVDVDQSSNATTSLDNSVKLRYEGDEDDMIKSVELGNTNLSLQGASIRQDGLFGIKTVAKLGNVDLVTIASKQEGKSETSRFTPSGEKTRVAIYDLDYIKRQYFFLADHALDLDINRLEIWRDDGNPTNNQALGAEVAYGRLNPSAAVDSATNPQRLGNFHLMSRDEYEIKTDVYLLQNAPAGVAIPVIKLRTPLGSTELLGVSYVERIPGGGEVRVGGERSKLAPGDTLVLKMIHVNEINDIRRITGDTPLNGQFDPNDPWFPVLAYEMRNFYSLNGRNIDPASLNIVIRRIDNSNPFALDPEAIGDVPLVKILGVDQRGVPGSANPDVPDGKVDDQFIDEEQGLLFFPDLHPFDPVGPGFGYQYSCGVPGRVGFLCLDDTTRNTLRRNPGSPLTDYANPQVYYTPFPNATTDRRYYIDAEFQSARQGYFLGRFNILENSEQVKIDGIPQQKGKDYNIDYDTGQLTFTRPPGPEQVITVDYSFAAGIGQVQRSLLGFSASYSPSASFTTSSSMLYESRGAFEQNPKLGEEPARSMLADFSTIFSLKPTWMTQAANIVPGVNTNAISQLNVQGNLAMSLPNPNTRGEAYLDDMEGTRESNTFSLTRLGWFWSSPPADSAVVSVDRHARLQWYNARGIKERDLRPVLTNPEGGDNERQVLELNVRPPTGAATVAPDDWTGLTQLVSTTGVDLSKLRFVDLWVNDFTHDHTTTEALLHIDFGRVSEDAFWHPDSLPNGKLDTEDRNQDTRLDFDEDTGLDGLPDEQEGTTSLARAGDPAGDNYAYDLDNATDYSTINNYEGNGLGDANARPDTEDLNRNGIPDFDNRYFEATINLADTTRSDDGFQPLAERTHTLIDVPKDYFSYAENGQPIAAENGWRLYRIPITGETFRNVGGASWDNIQQMRIWLSGMPRPTRLQIGGIELVGSRWLAQAIPDSVAAGGTSLEVGTRNNKDDASVYTPPFDPENQVGSTATRREQSLALIYSNLEAGEKLLAFKTLFDIGGSGLGYTQYRELRFWIHGDPGAQAQDVRVVARFGADTLSFYEYSAPVRSGWQDVRVPMERLSRLKDLPTAQRIDSTSFAATGEIFAAYGNPSFTRVNRISFGVEGGPAAPGPSSGEVWINELRLTDVRKDRGSSGNVSLQANFADLLAVNVSVQHQDQDFFRVGTGTNQGSGFNRTAVGLSTTLQVDRLMPTSGVQLPLRVSIQDARDIPKFRTGSDVVLDESRSDLETRRQRRHSIDLSYRRTSPKKGIAKYTIDALTASMTYSRAAGLNPVSADSAWSFNANVGYDLPIGGGGIGLGRKMKINLLPETVGFTANWTSTRDLSFARTLTEDGDSLTLRSDAKRRDLALGFSTAYIPVSGVRMRYSVNSLRNMLVRQEGPFGKNKGREVDHRQGIELNYQPRWLTVLSPTINLSGSYHEASRPELRIVQGDPEGLKNIDNRGTARVTVGIPISRLGRLGAGRAHGTISDSTGSVLAAALSPIRFVFGKMQDVQGTFTFDRSSAVSRVEGNPGFGYKVGFSEVLGADVARLTNSSLTAARRYQTGGNTTFRPLNTLNVDIRADHQLAFTSGFLGSRRRATLSWPDVRARWNDVHRVLGLQGALSTMTLNSGYSLKTDDDGPEGDAVEITQKTTNFGPLLGWDLNWRNGIRTAVSTSINRTESLDERLRGFSREREQVSTEIRLSKVFPSSKGLKLPFSKKRIRLRNDLNMSVNVNLTSTRSVVERIGFPLTVEADTDQLNLTGATTYNFTQQMSGNMNFAYRQTKDNKSAIIQRGITLGISAQFTF